MNHKYMGHLFHKGDTGKGAPKMIELKTFRTIHSNDQFEGDAKIGGYQVEVSGLLRLHFCAGDDVTPGYEEYEIAQITIDAGGYDFLGGEQVIGKQLEQLILEEIVEQLSHEQCTLQELWCR